MKTVHHRRDQRLNRQTELQHAVPENGRLHRQGQVDANVARRGV